MLNNLEDVKLFIEWCKAHKVKVFKSEKIEFELSEISFVENLEINDSDVQTHLDESEHKAKQQEQQEDDELLFWSSNT